MSFSIKAMCQHGDLVHRRKTAEAALKKAREMSRPVAMTFTSRRPKAGTTTHLSSQICLVPAPLRVSTRKLNLPISQFRFRVP